MSCNDEADISETEPYIEMWEQLFQRQNGMNSKYFAEHIKLKSSERLNNEYGEYFRVDYTVSFDWFEAHVADSFMIFINGVPDTSLIMPKNQYLWYAVVDQLIKSDLLNSHISYVGSWDQLVYTDLDEAKKYLSLVVGDCEKEYLDMVVSQRDIEINGSLTKQKGDPCILFLCDNSNIGKPCSSNHMNLISTMLSRQTVQCD